MNADILAFIDMYDFLISPQEREKLQEKKLALLENYNCFCWEG